MRELRNRNIALFAKALFLHNPAATYMYMYRGKYIINIKRVYFHFKQSFLHARRTVKQYCVMYALETHRVLADLIALIIQHW